MNPAVSSLYITTGYIAFSFDALLQLGTEVKICGFDRQFYRSHICSVLLKMTQKTCHLIAETLILMTFIHPVINWIALSRIILSNHSIQI